MAPDARLYIENHTGDVLLEAWLLPRGPQLLRAALGPGDTGQYTVEPGCHRIRLTFLLRSDAVTEFCVDAARAALLELVENDVAVFEDE